MSPTNLPPRRDPTDIVVEQLRASGIMVTTETPLVWYQASGVGKRALRERITAALREAGWLVSWGEGEEFTSGMVGVAPMKEPAS